MSKGYRKWQIVTGKGILSNLWPVLWHWHAEPLHNHHYLCVRGSLQQPIFEGTVPVNKGVNAPPFLDWLFMPNSLASRFAEMRPSAPFASQHERAPHV